MMEISDLRQSTILYLYSDRDHIKLNPEYQRMGDIWTLEKRQLLIDSILNGFDIPKIYFHKFVSPVIENGIPIRYSIVDGRQRLEAIWKYIDGDYPLSEDFTYLENEEIKAGGLTYRELGKKYPSLKIKFDAYDLSVVTIETDDLEIIEDMFSRLNEAVPLSAAEKRNAYGGPIPTAIRTIARHTFFKKHLPFTNKRYRHYDLAVKFLLFSHKGALTDTKKVYLDAFVKEWRDNKKPKPTKLQGKVKTVLDRMSDIFIEKDPLLKSVGNVVLYYYLFSEAIESGWIDDIDRHAIDEFEKARSENRKIAQEDISEADYDLLEFDRYIQTPNDSYALSLRFKILMEKAFEREWSPKR
ncbi:MAG: DUF262 domain-containing protein [Candidatus Thiodiazotropha sp.]